MPSLRGIRNDLDRARTSLLATASAFPDAHWKSVPGPGAWSAAEVIAHLSIVERTVVAGARRIIGHPPKPVPLGRRFHIPVTLVRFRWRRVKSPLPLDSTLLAERDAMLAEIQRVRLETLSFLHESSGRDLAPYRWPHPFLGSLNLYQWFGFLSNHERRHTKQLQEIVNRFRK